MEYISPEDTPVTSTRILCCQCAVPIEANPSNMCVACLRAHVDVTDGIPKQATLFFCRGCTYNHQQNGLFVHWNQGNSWLSV
ncbi:unnamed protein product [Leptidea sinapis]|uniref:60S ribosomal export protein NMD3 n=1 Tax=Leptidea sinapis TaxID=189913 RepID=A0A5E4QUH6_9NEOP|nr:unnamed protein product [Leptidea sinapis]